MNTEQMRRYMIGIIYEQNKFKKNELYDNRKRVNTEQIKKYSGHRTAVKIAEDFHISPGTVQKYYRLYCVIKNIRKKSPQTVNAIFSKDYRFSYNQIMQLSSMPSEKILNFIKDCRKEYSKKQSVNITDFILIIELWIQFLDECNRYIGLNSASICERQALCSKLTVLVCHAQSLIDVAYIEQ